MPNPFNVGGSATFPDLNNLKGVYQAMSQAKNPYQMFMNLAGNNPQLQPIIKAMQSGGNPEHPNYRVQYIHVQKWDQANMLVSHHDYPKHHN